jgi:hypothetical protein
MDRGDMKARVASLAAFVLPLLAAAPAAANGRYPSAQQLLVDPNDASQIWLRATYGLVTSNDTGKNWDWLCEAAVGYDAREDPMLAIAHGGKIFSGAFSGLSVTSDHGCNWLPDATIGNTYVRDVAADRAGAHVYAITSVARDNGNYDMTVWRSAGEPPVFAALGTPIASDSFGFTIDVAPSDPDRLYISGAVWPLSPAAGDAGTPSLRDAAPSGPNGPAVFFRSTDGGKTWTRRRLLGASLYNTPYIAAVDPINPDVVYVRVRGQPQTRGTITSRLLYSDDAGDSFREIFHASADMLGFAVSPDGKKAFVGLGDARDLSGQRQVDPAVLGIYQADTASFAFSRIFEGQIGCLTYTDDTLYACGAHTSTHFEIAASKDDGKTFTPLLDFGQIRGPLACPVTSAERALCTPAWPAICDPVGVCPSTSGSGGSGGTSTTDASVPPVGAEPEPPKTTRPSNDSGCCGSGSKTAMNPSNAMSGLGVAFAACVGLGSRRERRRRRS